MSREIYGQIADFARKLGEEKDLEKSLEIISEEARTLLKAERCSLFMVDCDTKMLWTKYADGIGRIAISLDSGIVGKTYERHEAIIENNPYENEFFMAKIDEKSGFKTENILTMPIFDSKHEVIGIIQLLNKLEGEFNLSDIDVLSFFANYISGTLELALMFEE